MAARTKLEIFDVEQDSPEWYAARMGKATASEFSTILADGVGRTTLLRKLAGERHSGLPMESYNNQYMDRGKRMEPLVRDWYAKSRFVTIDRTGFVFNPDIGAGWSPDGIVGKEGAVEFKSVAPHLLIPILEKNKVPSEHLAQCHGGIWVGRRKWIDLVLFYPGMPKAVFRIERDRSYEFTLLAAINDFNADLKKLVRKIPKLGER